jgi:aminoglycoside phosphotransferase (APT) family kinase protein
MIDFSALEGHQDMLSPGNPDVARLREDARILLTQIDAREGLDTTKVIPIPAGMWNALYLLEPAGVVVKLSAMNNAFEVDFLRDAAVLDVPVPKVFSAGRLEHPELSNATYFVMSYIDGSANAWQHLHSDNVPPLGAFQRLGEDVGRALARLHSKHLGYITHFNDRIPRWQQALTDGFSPDWDDIAPNALFNGALLDSLRQVIDDSRYFDFSEGTLCHGDLVLTNVMIDPKTHRLRAIIDPGNYAGMPMFDLAYAAMPWDHGFEFHHALVDAYKREAGGFNQEQFYVSMLVVAYRHERFHTSAVRQYIEREILPQLQSG